MQISNLKFLISNSLKSKVISNSFWGVFSNIFQNILFSIFFIVIARKYATIDFSNYIISTTLYGFVLAFSSLGLGQWFIRALMNTIEKQLLINQFFKIQLVAGIFFYIVNIFLSFLLYEDILIRKLSIIIGINIIFDNIIYVIKFVNIATYEQKRTFFILTIEAILKFLMACFLFIYQLPILYLVFLLICLRFITLNLFLKLGCVYLINIKQIWSIKVKAEEVKNIVFSNWSFIVIGSIAVIYWKIGNIIVSKLLSITDVANFEISFKLFSIVQILPVIISTSIFPVLVKLAEEDMSQFIKYYRKVFFLYALYGVMAYTFIFSYADSFVPFIFGEKYASTSIYSKQMFLTILVFPTALLQANVLIALKQERIDMWLNITSLMANCIFCFVGLYFLKSLTIINFSIFISFLLFHIIQDIFLVKFKIISVKHILSYLFFVLIFIIVYLLLFFLIQTNLFFVFFWFTCLVMFSIIYYTFFIWKSNPKFSIITIKNVLKFKFLN